MAPRLEVVGDWAPVPVVSRVVEPESVRSGLAEGVVVAEAEGSAGFEGCCWAAGCCWCLAGGFGSGEPGR